MAHLKVLLVSLFIFLTVMVSLSKGTHSLYGRYEPDCAWVDYPDCEEKRVRGRTVRFKSLYGHDTEDCPLDMPDCGKGKGGRFTDRRSNGDDCTWIDPECGKGHSKKLRVPSLLSFVSDECTWFDPECGKGLISFIGRPGMRGRLSGGSWRNYLMGK